jgi:hypothetical protein
MCSCRILGSIGGTTHWKVLWQQQRLINIAYAGSLQLVQQQESRQTTAEMI